jgi:hypothetical protein
VTDSSSPRGAQVELVRGTGAGGDHAQPDAGGVSDELERWLDATQDKTLGGLVEFSGIKSFALLFVLLLGVPALPLPTGGATHLFELIAMVVALQLIAGREHIWLPRGWRGLTLGGRRERFLSSLMGLVHRLQRVSRPRLRFLFGHRVSGRLFGLLVVCGSLAAFLAPPFTGLDTLPALGVVLLSLAVLLEDALLVLVSLVTGVVGVVLEVVLGSAAIQGLGSLI